MLRTALRQAIAGPWLRDPLWTRARAVPALDLDFAGTGSLRDRVSGLDLVTFTRASNATRITSQGTLETLGNDVPRFTHDPSTGRPLGLLVEEARTNLLLRSEEFDNASWTKTGLLAFGSGSVANSVGTLAPDGTNNADLLIEDTSTGAHQLQQGTPVAGTSYSYSVYAKAAGRTKLTITGGGFTGQGFTVMFNLSTGTLDQNGGTKGSITSCGNGWYRCAISFTASNTVPFSIVFASDALSTSYTGDGTSGIYLWGAQLEAGAFPTSYIGPTLGTAANRAADVATGTSGVNFNALRTLYVEFASPTSGTRGIVSLNDNTANERLALNTSTADPLAVCVDGGVTQASLDAGTVTANQMSKFAARFNTNDFAASFNGGAEVTDTSGTLPTVDRIMIGRSQAGEYLNGPIRRIMGWTQALPMLQELGR